MVATGVSGIVLGSILTATLQLTASSVRVTHYAEMDSQVRRAFEQLAADARAASGLTWNGASDVTLTVEKSDGTTAQFTYAWNSSSQSFYRVPGTSSASTSGRVHLVSGATALAFSRLDTSGNATQTDSAAKRLKISLTVARTSVGAARASSSVAAIYTLRNKPAS